MKPSLQSHQSHCLGALLRFLGALLRFHDGLHDKLMLFTEYFLQTELGALIHG